MPKMTSRSRRTAKCTNNRTTNHRATLPYTAPPPAISGMYTGSTYHSNRDSTIQARAHANPNEAGPSRIVRPPRRCFGNNPERSGVRRFRGLETGCARVLFSPPVVKQGVSGVPTLASTQEDADSHSTVSSPLSSPPSSPLVFSDEEETRTEGQADQPTHPDTTLHPTQSTTSSPLSSVGLSPLIFSDEEEQERIPPITSCASSPLSSAPNSPRAPSSSSHALPPSECGSPFDAFNAALQRLQQRRQSSSSLGSTSSKGKRRRLDSHQDDGGEPCRSSPPEANYQQYISRSAEKSPAVQRAQRQRRQANRSPVVLTDLTQAGGNRPKAIYPKPTTASSPIQPSISLRRKQQRSVAASVRAREATPPTSTATLNTLLTASQARPLPPADHPGRSQHHAQERTSQKAQYQKQDGNVVDLDAIFGDGAISADEILKNTLFLGDNDAGSQDEDDVVYELLQGRRRRRRRATTIHQSPDEIARFFLASNKKKQLDDDALSSPCARYSTHTRRRRYTLPAPVDLPPTSSYARVKREEGSPTREIKRVKARRVAARGSSVQARVSGGAAKTEEIAQIKSSDIRPTIRAKPLSGPAVTTHYTRNPEMARMADRIRRSIGSRA